MPNLEGTKECPLCGETMRLQAREETTVFPGSSETRTRTLVEWVCRECDYFEEYDRNQQDV